MTLFNGIHFNTDKKFDSISLWFTLDFLGFLRALKQKEESTL